MSSDQKMIIITAPSGAGKTTICRYLIEQIKPLEFSVSATNRKARDHEKHGRDYYFYTTTEFRRMIENGELLEWEEVYNGQYYGTPVSEVSDAAVSGKILLFDIDVKGALNLKEKFGESALSIFIKPPSFEELKRRLTKRNTEDEKSLAKRLKRAAFEIEQEKKFDIIIVNDQLEEAQLKALKAIETFISNEKSDESE